MRLLLAITLTALPQIIWAADTPQNSFCIANASDVAHVFTTETREGARRVKTLAVGETLCSEATAEQDGVIGVFESLNSVEGCARIVPRGETETLVEYAEFDRCRWGSHGP